MQTLTADRVSEWKGRIIDVRSPQEFAGERLHGAECVPLATLPGAAGTWDRGAPLLVMCKSGMRSKQACEQLSAAGFTNISMLGGGIDACKKAGLSVIAGRKVLPIFQQVMIAAGTLILTGLLLGRVHPAFYLIDWFVACGMVFAGITGFCGMAKLLERMPWNQVQPVGAAPAPAASSGSCCAATSSCCISKPQGVKP